MPRWFRLRKFDELQHYADRSPPWIKLYNRILDDYDVCQLGDAARWHLVAIMLLASRSNNRIPWDSEWIAKQISASQHVDLDALAKANFILEIQEDEPLAKRKRPASKMLAQRRERDREEKTARADFKNGLDEDQESARWRARMAIYKPGGFWLPEWGGRPESGKCACPKPLLAEWRARIGEVTP